MATVVLQNKFSLTKQREESQKDRENKNLLALVCGPRGIGKSTFIGTSNLPTLFISSFTEKHNFISACSMCENQNDIIHLFCDKDENRMLNEQESFDRIIEILDWALLSDEVRKDIKVIAFDGLSVADLIIQKHPAVIGATSFDKSKMSQFLFMKIIKKLVELNEYYHVICTMPSTYSYHADGTINSAGIDLTGLANASAIPGIFDQILPILQFDNKNYISMDICFNKTGKSRNGEKISFGARLTGFSRDTIHNITKGRNLIKADVKTILNLYKAKKEGKLDKYLTTENNN